MTTVEKTSTLAAARMRESRRLARAEGRCQSCITQPVRKRGLSTCQRCFDHQSAMQKKRNQGIKPTNYGVSFQRYQTKKQALGDAMSALENVMFQHD